LNVFRTSSAVIPILTFRYCWNRGASSSPPPPPPPPPRFFCVSPTTEDTAMADKKAVQSSSALGNKVLEILMEFLLGKKIAVRPHERRVGKEAERAQFSELGVGICLLPWSE